MSNNRFDDGSKTQKSMIFNTISGIVSILISFCTTILITRFISTSDLGIATSFINLKNIITLIAGFSIHYSINRMMIEKYKNDYEYLSSIYISSTLSMLFFFIVYLIFHDFFNNLFGFSFKMMVLLFSMILCINGANILTTYFNFKNNYKVMFIYNLLCLPIAQIMSLVLCYLLTSRKYIGRIVGLDSFSITFGIIFGIIILIRGKFTFNKNYVKDSLKISIPMIPHLLSQILLSGCDLIMIKNIIGSSEAGIYGMAYSVASILFAILIQLFNPWSPWVYRRLKSNEIDSIKSNSKVLTVLCFYLCFGLFTVAPDMINIFLPSTYSESIKIVAPIAIGIYFQIMYLYFYDIEYFYKKNKEISLFSVITAIINIVLNIICINKFGYKAAAYTTVISYMILFFMHYLEMRHIEKRKIYDVKFIVFLSVILMLASLLYYLFDYNIILRYLMLLIISIIVLINYKKIIGSILNLIRPNRKEKYEKI